MPMAVTWKALEDAVLAQVGALAGVQTILAEQGAPQPALPFVRLKLMPLRQAANGSWPATVQSYDATRPAGQEVELDLVYTRELVVSLQAYTPSPSGDGAAREILQAVQDGLYRPSVLQALRAVGLALIDPGDMQDLTALVETTYQGRAALDVRFLVSSEVVERTGYIERADVTATYR